MRTIDQLVQQEINCCMSSLVATLASGYGHSQMAKELELLCEQAVELCSTVPDYEEAACDVGLFGDEADQLDLVEMFQDQPEDGL